VSDSLTVLQVTSTHVYPPATGGQHRNHGIVSAYPDHGDDLTRFAQGAPTRDLLPLGVDETRRIRDGYVERRSCDPLAMASKLPMLAGYPNVFQNAALSLRTPRWVRRAAAEADLVQVEGPWQLPAVAEHVPESTPLVFSSHNVETEVFEANVDSRVGGWLLNRLHQLERRSLELADVVVCTSARDERQFDRRFGVDGPTLVAPNGTEATGLRDASGDSAAGQALRERYGIAPSTPLALFVGTGHRPNVDAVGSLLAQFAEDSRLADTHLLVVGTVCERVEAPSTDRVTLAGFVDDIEPCFDAADVALNTVTTGSGSNIKLLEYLGRGLPTLATPFGTRGFEFTDGEQLRVAAAEDVPAAVADLFGAPAERRRLGKRGLAAVRERYTWERISDRLRDRLEAFV